VDNWLLNLVKTKKIVKKGADKREEGVLDLGKLTREETIKADRERQIKALSDSNLAEMIAELELQGKGVPEQMNAMLLELRDKVSKNRKESEDKLRKLLPEHSKLDEFKFFERIQKKAALETTLGDYGRKVIAEKGNPGDILVHLERRSKFIPKEQLEEELIDLNAVLSDTALRMIARNFIKYLDEEGVDLMNEVAVKGGWNKFAKTFGHVEEADKIVEFIEIEPVKKALKKV